MGFYQNEVNRSGQCIYYVVPTMSPHHDATLLFVAMALRIAPCDTLPNIHMVNAPLSVNVNQYNDLKHLCYRRTSLCVFEGMHAVQAVPT